MEGTACFNPVNCNPAGLTLPILEYSHAEGCSVTGGYRYRGSRNPGLSGIYFFADFCEGTIFAGTQNPDLTWTRTLLLVAPFAISTFGEDVAGEVYVADYSGGTLHRIVTLQMSVDTPANGAVGSQPLLVAGWAVTGGATAGTGVDAVHVYAQPAGGGAPIFLGAASYGAPRPDIAAAFGPQFTNSGFALIVTGLAPGVYQLQVFARSTVTGGFDDVRLVSITVPSGARMALDAPAPGTSTAGPLVVGGWALDLAATSGTGVDAVHVYAFPAAGGAPIFLGAATHGEARPDIGALFGPQFTGSGFSLTVVGLAPGAYRVQAFVRSTVTGAFGDSRAASITIVPGARMALDAPVGGTSATPPVLVTGWAVDLSAPAGTGVDAVHVYAQPTGGGAPIFLGEASYGTARPDIGALFGARFTSSGFALTITGLSPGSYQLQVFARSTVTGLFNARTATVTILASARMNVDTPAPGAVVALPFLVAGWAIDLADLTSTGVDAIHVYAVPTAGGPPVFLGEAAYGVARSDIGALFGARFTNSGYQLVVDTLAPGSYLLQVFARSSASGAFTGAPPVPLTVP
jgi:hypothetical protein